MSDLSQSRAWPAVLHWSGIVAARPLKEGVSKRGRLVAPQPGCFAAHALAWAGTLKHRIAWFRRDEKAGVAVIFGMSAIPLMALLAIGVDYSRAGATRSQLQSVLDGATLAGASATGALTATQRQTIAATYFNGVARLKSGAVTSTSFAYDAPSGAMTGDVTTSLPLMLGLLWQASFTVKAHSTASVGSAKVRALDIALCVDTTGSMSSTLGAVQTNALNFKSNLDAALANAGVPAFDRTRVRVIYYRDYGGNGYMNITSTDKHGRVAYPYGGPVSGANLGDSVALNASSFYTLPTDNNAYSNFVNGSSASGGGDLPESGLECLNNAMASSWTTAGSALSSGKAVEEVYPVIAIYTDAGAHPPGFASSLANPDYPAASVMPRDYAGMLAKWSNAAVIDQTNKMILFYGNPAVDDDYYFANTSAWQTVKMWPGFSNPGSLTSANLSFVSTLATGIATNYKQPTLTH